MKTMVMLLSLTVLSGCGIDFNPDRTARWAAITQRDNEALATAHRIVEQGKVELQQSIQKSHEANMHLSALLEKSRVDTLADLKKHPWKYRHTAHYVSAYDYEPEGMWPDACDEYSYVSRHIDCQ
jgi:hypothetical protein